MASAVCSAAEGRCVGPIVDGHEEQDRYYPRVVTPVVQFTCTFIKKAQLSSLTLMYPSGVHTLLVNAAKYRTLVTLLAKATTVPGELTTVPKGLRIFCRSLQKIWNADFSISETARLVGAWRLSTEQAHQKSDESAIFSCVNE